MRFLNSQQQKAEREKRGKTGVEIMYDVEKLCCTRDSVDSGWMLLLR